MSAKRKSYLYSRVAIWLSVGTIPSVTIACSTFRVNELAYRTSPTQYELISRHISRVDNRETFPLDRPMLERVRRAITGLSAAVRLNSDEYIKHDESGSNWFFQPRQDGWFALFDGQANDARAFHCWLTNLLILKQADRHV